MPIQQARQTRLGGVIPLFTVFQHRCPNCGREPTVPSWVAIGYWLMAGSLLGLLVVGGLAAEFEPGPQRDGTGSWFLALPALAWAWLWGGAIYGIWATKRYPRIGVSRMK